VAGALLAEGDRLHKIQSQGPPQVLGGLLILYCSCSCYYYCHCYCCVVAGARPVVVASYVSPSCYSAHAAVLQPLPVLAAAAAAGAGCPLAAAVC
jgi:hypothetical protein